jgi:hypothetical protein
MRQRRRLHTHFEVFVILQEIIKQTRLAVSSILNTPEQAPTKWECRSSPVFVVGMKTPLRQCFSFVSLDQEATRMTWEQAKVVVQIYLLISLALPFSRRYPRSLDLEHKCLQSINRNKCHAVSIEFQTCIISSINVLPPQAGDTDRALQGYKCSRSFPNESDCSRIRYPLIRW